MVIPRQIKKNEKQKVEVKGKTDYRTQYDNMLEFVDGMNLETLMPELLLTLFKNGRMFIYCDGNTSSKTVTTLKLPQASCKPGFQTQFGTSEVIFDCRFFDTLSLSAEKIQELLLMFPAPFTGYYADYKQDRSLRYVTLDTKHATCFSMNDKGFPSFLTTFYDIIDYKTYKLNELNSNTNKLERIVTQMIDLDKTGLTLTEVSELHESIATDVESDGTKFITSVGQIDVKQMQEASAVQDTALKTAYTGIFNNAGLNDSLFTGTTADSIKVSAERDAAMVWTYIQQINAFLNITINNIHNFGNYQVGINFLPITHYNEKEKVAQYNENATLGVGIINFIVATGEKQIDIEPTLKLEETLGLSTKLTPLQSSHTQSSTGGTETDDSKTEDVTNKEEDKEEIKQVSNTGGTNEK